MSININLVSDKPNFQNFFSEPITLPERAELVMTKVNMDIPVIHAIATEVPFIPVANYNDTALTCNLDGVVVSITWQNLYDAYASLMLKISTIQYQ